MNKFINLNVERNFVGKEPRGACLIGGVIQEKRTGS